MVSFWLHRLTLTPLPGTLLEKTPVNAQPTLAPAASCSDQPWASNARDNDKKTESTVIAAVR